ncbi:MAG: PepSY domain-containing protein [Planctomycetota bacterium]|jgi:hypothetical protein
MTFDLFNKRLHLYLGLFLIVFFLKYAVSGLIFSHDFGLREYYKDKPQWTKRFERPYERPVPENADLQPIAAQILKDAGVKSRAFGVRRAGNKRLNINTQSFWPTTRVTYFIDQNRLLVEDKNFRWDHFILKFHWVGGYQHDSLIRDIWALIMDIVFIATIFWVISGIYIWWKIRETRFWGCIALGGGVVSFLIFVFML